MKKIVHIDNSEFFRKLMKAFLEEEGFEVQSYESAQDANLAIGSEFVDMVIMGLAFADLDAHEFLKRTVEEFAGPIIVLSSSVDNREVEELITHGAKLAINKSGPWKQILKPHLSALKQA